MKYLSWWAMVIVLFGPQGLIRLTGSNCLSPDAKLIVVSQDNSIATEFYRGLAQGVSRAKGELHFKLLPGVSVTNIDNTIDIRWAVQVETDVLVKLDFRDATQQWKSLSMQFSPRPIIASFREGRVDAKRHQITRIDFRKNGEPLEYYDEFNQPIGLALSRFPEIRQHLKILNGPSALFLGQPFAGAKQAVSGGLVVKEVNILSQTNVARVTNITLGEQAELVFAPGNSGLSNIRNWIRLQQPASVDLKILTYRPSGGLTKGTLGPLSLRAVEGQLGTANTSFILDSGDALSFAGISFSTESEGGMDGSVIAEGGTLSGRLKANSRIEVARTDRGPALLEINSSETSELKGLTLTAQGLSLVTLEIDSATLPVTGMKGEIQFDNRNYLNLHFNDAPSLRIVVGSSAWRTDKLQRFSGDLPAFGAGVLGGQMVLNNQSIFKLASGQISSSGIRFKSSDVRPASGSFSTARLTLAKSSSLGVTDQFSAVIASGIVDVASSGHPLLFNAGIEGPLGQFSLSAIAVQSGAMKLGHQGSIQLTSGALDGVLTRTAERGVEGRLSGQLTAGTGVLELDSSNVCLINNGSLRFASLAVSDATGVGGSFQSVSFSLQPSSSQFSDKLTASTKAGGTFTAENPSAPFLINANGDVTGKTALHLPIAQGLLLLGGIAAVPLEAGTIDADANITGSQRLTGTVKLDATMNSGTFEFNSTTVLHIKQGHVQADQLVFQNPDVLTGDFTTVDFKFAESSINLPNSILGGFSSAFLDADGGPLTIHIGPGGNVFGAYHLHLVMRTGDMTLGRVGSVKLSGGTIDLFWKREINHPEEIRADADVTISSGNIEPIPGSRVAIKGGSRFKATTLTVSNTDGITGALGEVDLTLGQSRVVIPGGFILDTKDGGRLTAKQSSPLVVAPSGSFLQGSLLLDLPFSNFYNAQDVSFQLENGKVHLPLVNGMDGSITGSNCSINGTLVVTFSNAPNPSFDIPVAVALTNGSLTKLPGSAASFSSALNAQIPSGIEIPITTKAEDQGGDKHLFSINLKMRIASNVNLTGTIALNGAGATVPTMSQTASISAEILGGNGEHPDGDFNNTNGNNAPNQEIFTDTFSCPFGCRLHVFLRPRAYGATARVRVGLNSDGMAISVDSLNLPQEPEWFRDGCDVCIAFADIWTFITGQDSPKTQMQRKLTEKIAGFQYTLKHKTHP